MDILSKQEVYIDNNKEKDFEDYLNNEKLYDKQQKNSIATHSLENNGSEINLQSNFSHGTIFANTILDQQKVEQNEHLIKKGWMERLKTYIKSQIN